MEDIYKKAVDLFGDEAQIISAIQEMAELIKELTDIRRERTTKEQLATEIVDVEIMLGQLKYIFSKKYSEFNEILEIEHNKKLKKLEKKFDQYLK
jgi:hypothetical protein